MFIQFVLGIIGFLVFLQMLRDLSLFVYNMIFGKTRDLSQLYGKGSYALVTGGSEGIGFALAKQLAQRGFNLILISRSLIKLEEAKQSLNKEFPTCDVLIRFFDFTKIDNNTTWDFTNTLQLDFNFTDI